MCVCLQMGQDVLRLLCKAQISASIALTHMFYLTVEHAEEFISTVYCFMSWCIYIDAPNPQQCTHLTLSMPT